VNTYLELFPGFQPTTLIVQSTALRGHLIVLGTGRCP